MCQHVIYQDAVGSYSSLNGSTTESAFVIQKKKLYPISFNGNDILISNSANPTFLPFGPKLPLHHFRRRQNNPGIACRSPPSDEKNERTASCTVYIEDFAQFRRRSPCGGGALCAPPPPTHRTAAREIIPSFDTRVAIRQRSTRQLARLDKCVGLFPGVGRPSRRFST
jgi:hypothetical protein